MHNHLCQWSPEQAGMPFCITRRELLTVVHSSNTFDHTSLVIKFTLHTDHGVLKFVSDKFARSWTSERAPLHHTIYSVKHWLKATGNARYHLQKSSIWLHIWKVCMVYNTSTQSTTSFTPFFLMFGCHIMFGTDKPDIATYGEYTTKLKDSHGRYFLPCERW